MCVLRTADGYLSLAILFGDTNENRNIDYFRKPERSSTTSTSKFQLLHMHAYCAVALVSSVIYKIAEKLEMSDFIFFMQFEINY